MTEIDHVDVLSEMLGIDYVGVLNEMIEIDHVGTTVRHCCLLVDASEKD